ncbi:MAG: hypothetical protein ACJA1X_002358 [Bermanella sp.]|jgi:hypothetical protein
MKILLFTLLYFFASALFANSYIAPGPLVAESLDTSFICDALLVQGDTSDTDHSDALQDKVVEDYRVSFYLIKFSKFSAEANNQPLHFYHIRAPPFSA